jgi:hypothetical protein
VYQCGKYKLTALLATNARIKIFGFEEPGCREKKRCLASLLISAEKLIENYKAHTTSQLGFKIDFFGCPSAENRKNLRWILTPNIFLNGMNRKDDRANAPLGNGLPI